MDDGSGRGGVTSQLPREGVPNRYYRAMAGANVLARGAHMCCEFRGSLQHFGEFLGWCHVTEGLSRSRVERVGSLV